MYIEQLVTYFLQAKAQVSMFHSSLQNFNIKGSILLLFLSGIRDTQLGNTDLGVYEIHTEHINV